MEKMVPYEIYSGLLELHSHELWQHWLLEYLDAFTDYSNIVTIFAKHRFKSASAFCAIIFKSTVVGTQRAICFHRTRLKYAIVVFPVV